MKKRTYIAAEIHNINLYETKINVCQNEENCLSNVLPKKIKIQE